jgi:predicted alpha/beta-fold hydrolase
MVLQTVSSGLLEYFQTKLLEKKSHSFWDERERIDTPDGDFFHVDYKWNADFPKAQKSRHMVILLHGLESSSDSPLRLDMAEAFCHQGFDVAFINFRGCSGVPNDKLGSYHAGFTDDLLLFMTIMIQRWDQDGISLYLSGFSLGANVVMKCLGDLGTEAISKFNIRGAAVTGCPFDLKVQYLRLVDDPFNRMVYTRTLLRSMKEKAQYLLYKHSQGDENTKLFDYKKCRDAQTIVDIEEGLIVPVFGFHDKFDYYNKTASISVLKNIVVPTLVINAKDDPFLDPDYFPWDQDYNHGGQAPIKMVRTEFGGHVGYMFNIWAHETNIPCSSWVSSELARFAKHVQVSHYAYDVTSYLGR